MRFIPINIATGQEYDTVEAKDKQEAKEIFEHSPHLKGKYRYEVVEEEVKEVKKPKGVEKAKATKEKS